MLDRIEQTLEKLYRHYGEQNWWNDRNRLSDWVSMILIQQTTAKNAINALLQLEDILTLEQLLTVSDEELQQLIDEINADLKADKFKLEGFFADKELKNKFDFSKEINADTTVYLKFTELKEETTVKEEKNPATNDMNLALILASLGLASAGAVLVSRKKLAKANR